MEKEKLPSRPRIVKVREGVSFCAAFGLFVFIGFLALLIIGGVIGTSIALFIKGGD